MRLLWPTQAWTRQAPGGKLPHYVLRLSFQYWPCPAATWRSGGHVLGFCSWEGHSLPLVTVNPDSVGCVINRRAISSKAPCSEHTQRLLFLKKDVKPQHSCRGYRLVPHPARCPSVHFVKGESPKSLLVSVSH